VQVAEGLKEISEAFYLLPLVGMLGGAGVLVGRQVWSRRGLDEDAKVLGEKVRNGEATCEDYYQLGSILARKRLFTQAVKNLEKAVNTWDADEGDLAVVHNSLGFCFYSMQYIDKAVDQYEKAVQLQPGYLTAWNNLGDAYEACKKWEDALRCYKESLAIDPSNTIAQQRMDVMKTRVSRVGSSTN